MAAPGPRGKIKTAVLSLAAAGTQVIEAAAANIRVTVIHATFSSDNTLSLPSFESSAGTVLAGPFTMSVGSAIDIHGDRAAPRFWTAVGEGLTFRTAGAGNVKGVITYVLETLM